MAIPKEYLGAFKAGHRRESKDFIDEELSKTLLKKILKENCEESKKILAWLTKFNNEFHKNVFSKNPSENLHNTNELKKTCFERNNARQRDLFIVGVVVQHARSNEGMTFVDTTKNAWT